ncbi:MAG: hypothetical protein G01um101420_913 [Parcubacteria group bacterium Gr01-1014_20]|nr:MAG: hypothetical protein G01um101420_913 [Parcubacteria group bacterium Gr01-1014_20]
MRELNEKIKPSKISHYEIYEGKYVDSILMKKNGRRSRDKNRNLNNKRSSLSLQKKRPALGVFSFTKFVKPVVTTFSLAFGLVGRAFRGTLFIWKLSLVALALISIVPISAFEAHILNVTASLLNIDPPVISPPGGQYNSEIDITIDDADPDATYIFYTITPGTDPSFAPDPACGVYPGGPKPIGPITLTDDSVVKAIACDGPDGSAHASIIVTEIYDLNLKGKIEGRKYHDLDKSGNLTVGDTPIQGWQVDLMSGTSTVASTVTDATGYYTFNNLDAGSYSVEEETRSGWQAITLSVLSITIDGGETEVANFFNFDTGFACVPTDVNFPTDLGVQAGGATSGNDDVVLASNVTINADVRSNDEVEISGGGGNRTINGDVAVVNTIDTGITINGVSSTGASAVPLPDAMISVWKAKAQEGGTVNGSFTFPNNTVGLVMGPTEIMGNVTLGSSNGLSVRGPIYIHGNLTIGSNSTINQDAAFGNQFTTIIVDGLIDISSNITFNGAGSTGTFLLISTHAAVAGDDAAIQTNSNNSDLGDVVLYASDGDIHIRSNRTLLATFATHGTGDDADDNGAVRLDSNVTVNYRTLPTKISCGPRQPFETTSHVLVNEFMPNPTASDVGVVGGTLDGEWVEIFNPTGSAVDLAGYVLYDSINTHALLITSSNTDTGGTTVPSLGYLVVYRDGDTDFELNNSGGDTVRLFSGLIGSGGVLVDSHLYTRDAPENKSFARVPDGSSNWVDPDSTPGAANAFFFEALPGALPFEPAPMPLLVIEEEPVVVEPVVSSEPAPGEVIEIVDPSPTIDETLEAVLTDPESSSTPQDTPPAETEGAGDPASSSTTENSVPSETDAVDSEPTPPADSSTDTQSPEPEASAALPEETPVLEPPAETTPPPDAENNTPAPEPTPTQ